MGNTLPAGEGWDPDALQIEVAVRNFDKNRRRAAEARVVKRLEAKLQDRIMEVSGLGGFLGDPNQGGGPEDLEAVGDWAAFAKRHRDTFCYDDRRSPALISLRCKPKQNSKNKKMAPQRDAQTMKSAEDRVVQRLEARLQNSIMEVGALLTFLGDSNQGGGPADLAVAADWAAFFRRHPEKFCYDHPYVSLRTIARLPPERAPKEMRQEQGSKPKAGGKGGAKGAEERVVQRLTAKLQEGPIRVGNARSFLMNPQQGGGPEDRQVVANFREFVLRHSDVFSYDPASNALRLNTSASPGPSLLVPKPKPAGKGGNQGVEARVVQRLAAKLRDGPTTVGDVRSFLGNPYQGGGPEDLQIVANLRDFLMRHADLFSFDPASNSIRLCTASSPGPSPSGPQAMSQRTDKKVEKRVAQRLMSRLQSGPVRLPDLRSFLGDPNQGGGPEDLRILADWPSFVGRHTETIDYDPVTESVSLRSQKGPEPAPNTVPLPHPSSDLPKAMVVANITAVRAMCQSILQRCGSVPLLNFVTLHRVDACLTFTNADAVYVVDVPWVGLAAVLTACQPLLTNPGVLKAVLDVHFVSTSVDQAAGKLVGVLDVPLAFEHLTGIVDVDVADLLAAFGLRALEVLPVLSSVPGRQQPLAQGYADAVAVGVWRLHLACRALIGATRSESWASILSASTQRFQYLATAPHGARRVAFDRRCGHRLVTHELLMVTAPEDAASVPSMEGNGFRGSLVVILPFRLHAIFSSSITSLRSIILELSQQPHAFGAEGAIELDSSFKVVQDDLDRICEAIGIPTYVAPRGAASPAVQAVTALPRALGHAIATRNASGKVANLVLQAAPPIYGVVPLLMDIVVGRPDLNVLMVGMADSVPVLSSTLRCAAGVLFEFGRILLVGSPEFVKGIRGDPPLNSGQLECLVVPDPATKWAILRSGVNVHSPHTVIVDEIVSQGDVLALCEVMGEGVRVIAGVRRPLTELAVAPDFFPLFGIEGTVDGRSDSRKRTMTPPVGCIVTLQPQRPNESTVMLRVAETVDRVLDHGACPPAWIRTRDADGVVVQSPL